LIAKIDFVIFDILVGLEETSRFEDK